MTSSAADESPRWWPRHRSTRMSVATIERLRADTLYVAVTRRHRDGDAQGPSTCSCGEMPPFQDAVLVAATDADHAGDGYAARLAGMADGRQGCGSSACGHPWRARTGTTRLRQGRAA